MNTFSIRLDFVFINVVIKKMFTFSWFSLFHRTVQPLTIAVNISIIMLDF